MRVCLIWYAAHISEGFYRGRKDIFKKYLKYLKKSKNKHTLLLLSAPIS